eukprot:CAMPEP_0118705508 /NCGR_PEP_ID=MMETSP0800-20121206/19906_1 /TAXON_ID=210618 ORGANISM="Striatella unipunctata, Strain CCMP2910" /NCGR_SAMPLE_ID=MMETSP0800 /ASSEMBLY_ACC=CAM_ASM_000638 /LENGTH=146 /DNA_ID=CAMNT_0006607669 /DNA_START=26 /DNA_END=466 /DNA_ORIENTATION=+
MMMRVQYSLVFLLLGLAVAVGFAPETRVHRNQAFNVAQKVPQIQATFEDSELTKLQPQAVGVAVVLANLFTSASAAIAASTDDYEVSDLPPPIFPVLFAIGLLGGAGFLTASLGDVYGAEASLGFQSGARARRESERKNSSFFKKK